MRNLLLLALVSCSSAYANVEQPLAPPIVLDHEVVVSPFVRTAPPSVQHGPLARYALELMNGWPHAEIPTARLGDVAESIASAAENDPRPYEAAAYLAALAYWEGARFAAYVDDQSCNRWVHAAYALGQETPTGELSVLTGKPLMRRTANWLALPDDAQYLLRFGQCDGGRAYSLWQIHVEQLTIGGHAVTAVDLRDRSYAARVALWLVRRDGSLVGYTGERPDFHPKANQRRDFALAAMRRHPVRVSSASVVP